MASATVIGCTRAPTAAKQAKAAPALFEQLEKSLAQDKERLIKSIKGIVHFSIDDDSWTLDLREGQFGELYKGPPREGKPDITLTINDENFTKLVMGKLNPQQAFLLRKLKISGSMAMAMKLQPILEAARPQAKL